MKYSLNTHLMVAFAGLSLVAASMGCSMARGDLPTSAPATQPSDELSELNPFDTIRQELGKGTSERADLLTYVYPRTDISVQMDGYPVPAEAGLRTEIHFFKCPCGRMLLTGQYMLTEWEVNDVIDELRKANIQVVSVAQAFHRSTPQMMQLRFQGEGAADEFARAIKASFEWIGEARNAHQTLEELSNP